MKKFLADPVRVFNVFNWVLLLSTAIVYATMREWFACAWVGVIIVMYAYWRWATRTNAS